MKNEILIKKYFEQNSLIQSNIESFNNFIEKGMQQVVEEIGDVIPTITPPEIQNFKIKLDKIWVEKPKIIEADGSERKIYPSEARLRKLTYSAPIFLKINAHIDGVERESFETQIGKIPVMLKSKYCNLYNLKREELIEKYEDPDDPGGYFILNGNERVLIIVEDLASNKMFVERHKVGPSKFTANIFSEKGAYRIPHQIEQMRDGILYLTFTRFKRVPIFAVIKALGLTTDQEITRAISENEQFDDIFINLFNVTELKTEEDALEFLAKYIGIAQQPKDVRLSKVRENIDKYLLPHLGTTPRARIYKAYNLCKLVKRFLVITKKGIKTDKDHYMNKRLKLSGDLLKDLFRVNLRALVNDLLYNFQRLVKRGKYSSIKIIIREKLLTSRIKSAMATGTWVGGRKGISQNIDRTNFWSTFSHLQRVVSLLSTSQENFEARALHPTQLGRLCPIETPEGTPIGLRKNLALLSSITQQEISEDKLKKQFESYSMKKWQMST
ncbi:MAG: DNA-directed RNA polymerase subunit B'' [Candidatus Heimdallarchaeaceae archaeon]